jgi:hypothetical protein
MALMGEPVTIKRHAGRLSNTGAVAYVGPAVLRQNMIGRAGHG